MSMEARITGRLGETHQEEGVSVEELVGITGRYWMGWDMNSASLRSAEASWPVAVELPHSAES